MLALWWLLVFGCSREDNKNTTAIEQTTHSTTRKIYSVQIAALQDTSNISRLLARLRKAGQTVLVSPVATGDSQILRIGVGPFVDSARARDALEKVRDLGFPEAFVKMEEVVLEEQPEESSQLITRQKVNEALDRIDSYIENVVSSDSTNTDADSAATSEGKQLTDIGGCSYPRWSPSGREIAFLRNRGNFNGLFTIGTGGGSISRIVDKESGFDITGEYVWSPDGNKIALVVREITGGYEKVDNLYVVNKDGSGLRSLVKQSRSLFRVKNLEWSPDARHLAFEVFLGRTDQASDIIQQVRVLSVASGDRAVNFDAISNLRKTQWLLGWQSLEKVLYLSSIARTHFGSSFDYEVRQFDIVEGRDQGLSPRTFVSNCLSGQILKNHKQIIYSAFVDAGSRTPNNIIMADLATARETTIYTPAASQDALSEVITSRDDDIFFFHDEKLRVFDSQGQKATMVVRYSPEHFTVSPTGTRLCYARDGNLFLLRVPLQ